MFRKVTALSWMETELKEQQRERRGKQLFFCENLLQTKKSFFHFYSLKCFTDSQMIESTRRWQWCTYELHSKLNWKGTTEALFKRKTRNFSFLFCPLSSLNKIDMKKTDTSWNDLRKQRVIFSSVTPKERHRIRFHSILIENNTISSFSCSFISSDLLFPHFSQ